MSRAEDGLLLHLKKAEVMGMSGHQIAHEMVRLETENAELHDRVAALEKEGAEYEEQVTALEDQLRAAKDNRFDGIIETEGFDW